jgi:hypothetical protein
MSSSLSVNHISGSDGQLFVFSGSVATGDQSGFSPDPRGFTDTIFFVSGSASSQGRSDFKAGTAVFGGDLVVSGGIYHVHDPKMINRTGNMSLAPGYGDIIKMGATGGMDAGKLYFWKNNGWTKTDASNQVSGGMEYLLGIAMGDSAGINGVMIRGFVYVTITGAGTGDTGAPVYAARGTAGEITKTAPAATNDFVRVLGWIVDAGTPNPANQALIYFSPSQDWIEL